MRKIKIVEFTPADKSDKIEEKMNAVLAEIQSKGKLITVQSEKFGLQPIRLLFLIYYEAE